MRNRRKKCGIFMLSVFVLLIFFCAGTVAADVPSVVSEEKILDVLKGNQDFFVESGTLQDALRILKWGVLRFLYMLCQQAEQLYLECYKLLTFGTGQEIEGFVSQIQPIYQALLTLSIAAVGLMTMFFSKKIPEIFKGILLSVGIVTCSFFVMSKLNLALYDPASETGLITWALGEQRGVTNEIIRTNLYDLLYIDGKLSEAEGLGGGLADFDVEHLDEYHLEELMDENLKGIRINEVLNPEKASLPLSPVGRQVLSKKIFWLSGEEYVLEDVEKGINIPGGPKSVGNQFYYRYKVNFFDCILTFLAFVVVYVAVSFNVVKIIYQMVVSRILAVLYSADLTGVKKTVMVLNSIKDGYIALFLSAVTIRVFGLFQAFISQKFEDHPVINVIIVLMLALAVVLSPSIIEKLTGYNLGLSGGVGMLYFGSQMARGTASLVRAGTHGVQHVAEKVGSAFSGFGAEQGTYSPYGSAYDGSAESGSQQGIGQVSRKLLQSHENSHANQQEKPDEGPGPGESGAVDKNLMREDRAGKKQEAYGSGLNRETGNENGMQDMQSDYGEEDLRGVGNAMENGREGKNRETESIQKMTDGRQGTEMGQSQQDVQKSGTRTGEMDGVRNAEDENVFAKVSSSGFNAAEKPDSVTEDMNKMKKDIASGENNAGSLRDKNIVPCGLDEEAGYDCFEKYAAGSMETGSMERAGRESLKGATQEQGIHAEESLSTGSVNRKNDFSAGSMETSSVETGSRESWKGATQEQGIHAEESLSTGSVNQKSDFSAGSMETSSVETGSRESWKGATREQGIHAEESLNVGTGKQQGNLLLEKEGSVIDGSGIQFDK